MNDATGQATQPSADEIRKAATDLFPTDDPAEKAVIEKYVAGQPLSQREWGIFGWLKKKFSRKSDAPGQPALAGSGNAVAVDPSASDEDAGDSLPEPPADPGIVRRTTGAIVTRLESRDKRKVSGLCDSARSVGVDAKALARIERAAGLPGDDKSLLLDLAPDVFRELGVDPRKYATWVFAGVFILWRLDMMEAIDELRTIVKAKEEQQKEKIVKPAEPPRTAVAEE